MRLECSDVGQPQVTVLAGMSARQRLLQDDSCATVRQRLKRSLVVDAIVDKSTSTYEAIVKP